MGQSRTPADRPRKHGLPRVRHTFPILSLDPNRPDCVEAACSVQSTLGSGLTGWARELRPCERGGQDSSLPHMTFLGLCWLYRILWEKKLGTPGCKNSFCNWSSSQKSPLPVALERLDSPGSSQPSTGQKAAPGTSFLPSFSSFVLR